MAGKFTAQVTAFSDKAKRNIDLVVRQSAQDLAEAITERQPSVTETGGVFEIGKVPVDTGFLINSFISGLNGTVIAQGPDAYIAAIAGYEAGDSIEMGFTAEYARQVEYGTSNMQGRSYVREGVLQWQAIVSANAARLRD